MLVKQPGHRWRVTGIACATVVIGVCIAMVLSAFLPSRYVVPGATGSDQFTELTLAAMKAAFDLSAALTIGWLVAALALAPPQSSGAFDVSGYRAIRAAGLAAWVWTAVSLALVPLTSADQKGITLTRALRADRLPAGIVDFPVTRGYLICAVITLLIALFSRMVLRPGWAFVLLVVAVCGLLPQALGSVAPGTENHDIAVDVMIFHLVGISIWIGGLLAFLGMVRQDVPHLPVVARRYSKIALIAFVAVALSGMANAYLRLTYVQDLWATGYGRLVVVKAIALITLGRFGYAQRKRALPAIRRGKRRPLVRLATVELLIMGATVGVAAALGRAAPPPPTGVLPVGYDIALEASLGYPLSGPPTVSRLLLDWRFDYLLGTASIVMAVVYVLAVVRLRRRGRAWPGRRTWLWLLGCLVVLLATSSGLGRYAPSQFSIQVLAQTLMAVGAPILLVLGAPVTLMLEALPTAGKDQPPGLREAIEATIRGRVITFLTRPLVALTLFVGIFPAIYFTPLLALMIASHFEHFLINVVLLTAGYLYYWVVIGTDPGPGRRTSRARLPALVAAVPFYAFYGFMLSRSDSPMAAGYFHHLALPWVSDLVGDQQLGGALVWGAVGIPMAMVMVAVVSQWRKKDQPGDARAHWPENPASDEKVDS